MELLETWKSSSRQLGLSGSIVTKWCMILSTSLQTKSGVLPLELSMTASKPLLETSWKKPPAGVYKINMDGATSNDERNWLDILTNQSQLAWARPFQLLLGTGPTCVHYSREKVNTCGLKKNRLAAWKRCIQTGSWFRRQKLLLWMLAFY